MVDPRGQAAERDTRQAEIVRLRTEVERLQARIAELETPQLTPVEAAPIAAVSTTFFETGGTPDAFPEVTDGSAREAKVRLFRSLFVGRADVYALRWENKKTGKRGWRPAAKNGWRHESDIRDLLALTDDVMTDHLRGLITVGLHPLMGGDTCRLLECDFDGPGWELDARAYWEVCEASGVAAALERSRSGNGAHVWTFFEAPVPAASARAVGAALLREAMALRVELDLASYDRLFPSQDYLPAGKTFGNLIALPLQRECRRWRQGTYAACIQLPHPSPSPLLKYCRHGAERCAPGRWPELISCGARLFARFRASPERFAQPAGIGTQPATGLRLAGLAGLAGLAEESGLGQAEPTEPFGCPPATRRANDWSPRPNPLGGWRLGAATYRAHHIRRRARRGNFRPGAGAQWPSARPSRNTKRGKPHADMA